MCADGGAGGLFRSFNNVDSWVQEVDKYAGDKVVKVNQRCIVSYFVATHELAAYDLSSTVLRLRRYGSLPRSCLWETNATCSQRGW
jgi:hypothetical protein